MPCRSSGRCLVSRFAFESGNAMLVETLCSVLTAKSQCKPLRGRSHNKCWYYFENDLPKSAKCSSEQ